MTSSATSPAGRKILRCTFGLILLWFGAISVAAELRDIEVERDEDRYRLVSEAWFAASPEDMYRVLSDYDLFEKFTSAFVEARNIEPDEQGRPRFFARMEGCVLLFCKSFVRRGHLELAPHSEIVAVVDPAVSDFKYCHERWRLVRDGDGTLLVYTFEMEPGFWVPPVIGPYVIMRTLRDGGRDAIDRIEALAQGREPKR
ncbi:MAG: SRPBCC family protein [Woeseia sp.]